MVYYRLYLIIVFNLILYIYSMLLYFIILINFNRELLYTRIKRIEITNTPLIPINLF